jgi:hypothetical protein
MKKLFLTLIAISLTISCEKQDDAEAKVDFKNMKIDLKNSKSGNEVVLFSYQNSQDIGVKLPNSIESTIVDAREIIKTNSEITNVITNISMTNGKAVITGIFYVNEKTKKIIEGYVLNSASNTYSRGEAGWPEIFDGASCPDGFLQLGKCNNFDSPKTGVASLIANFFGSNLNGVGDCANVQVNVGAISTRVCGKTC